MELEGKHIAVLVQDKYDDLEFWYPALRLREAVLMSRLLGRLSFVIYQSAVCLSRRMFVRIRLGQTTTSITLVPERTPLLLAKEIASLDLFSGGRFLFGISTGWLREETELMGGDFEHRWTQTRESIEVMKAISLP